jgi:predicted phage terminase large subunit-like protein
MLSDAAQRLADALEDDWASKARPNQLPPPGNWTVWLLLAGRGFGKTRAGSEEVLRRVAQGTAKRIAIVGATAADVRDISVEGASGIMSCAPEWNRPVYESSKRRLTWPNGAIATLFSGEEPERARGPEHDFLWADELAAYRYPDELWAQLMLGLRIGKHPQCVITTTPKPTRLIKSLVAREGGDVVITRGSTYDNRENLAAAFFDTIAARYEGTRLGRQELNAELLEDTPGALWQLAWVDRDRVEHAPELSRIVVALDPAVSTTEGSDETGLVVAALGKDGHAYVLDDLSGKFPPHEWAARAIEAYRKHKADRIVAEVNQGGQMVEATLRTIDPAVAYKGVHASRGKTTRAEPVSALYEQRRIHHVGSFPELEDQLCSFTSDFDRASAGFSPDRLDALVWGLTELMLGPQQPTSWAKPISWTKSPSYPSSNPSFEGPVNAWGRFPE